MRAKIFLGSAICLAFPISVLAADWMQFGYDPTHSGNNTVESTLTANNVDQLRRRYNVSLPSNVDGAPVYLSNVSTSGGTRDLLFLLAQNGNLMAIDAADGSVVWQHQESGQTPTTSSPAIDPNRNFVYAYGLDGFAHKYNVGTGVEVTGGGWPKLITLKTDVEKVAGSLTIGTFGSTTYLYVVTDGYSGDFGDYQGHITTISLSTGDENIFNVMCSDLTIHFVEDGTPGSDDCNYADDPPMFRRGQMGGIWGRGGATYDAATNSVYVATGNGDFNASDAGFDWGDSVLALAPDGIGSGGGLPLDSYTPTNFDALYMSDTDLGSVSLAILPVPSGQSVTHLGAQLGKDAMIRLIDLDNMSGTNIVGSVGGQLQLIGVPQGGNSMSEQPAVWVDPQGTTWLLVANNAGVSGLKLRFTNLHTPFLESEWSHGGRSKSAVVANDVLYYAATCSGGYCLNAADPTTGDVLWTSSDHVGNLHWHSPIVINGAVYITDGPTLYRYDLGTVNNDLIFANGFDL